MNFVEVMALNRAFTFGRFKCSGVSPKISVADLQSEGYVLKIPKNPTRYCCLRCIKGFIGKGKLRITEDEKYLTIHSP